MRESLYKLLNTTPILKLLIPLMGGILTAKSLEIPLGLLVITSLFALLAALIFTLQRSLYNPGWYLSMVVFFFALGAGLFKIQLTAPARYTMLNESKHFVGIITSLAEPVKYGQRYETKIVYYRDTTWGWKACDAKVILYVKKHTGFKASPGQYVMLNNVSLKLQHAEPFPNNRSQREYYFLQNISGPIYAEQSNNVVALPFRSKMFLYRIQQLREQLLHRVSVYFTATAERSIFQSLFFGYRAEMDTELTNAYATAGVIHILSVSGLHVGIIYLFFIFITGPLKHHFLLRIFRTVLIVVSIWFYGLLAGFSPPVVRSCTMFTILGLAQLIQRETFSFNSLFLSAFTILLFAPYQLFDVGFQLSYAAMTGIFLFFKPFTQAINLINYAGKKVVELVAISVAAQLGTLPFTLYYFNSFPSYFILSNLIIVPFTTLIMYTGIVFLVLMPIAPFATYAADLLKTMIAWLNKMVLWIEQLPYASIKSFFPNLFESILLLCMILTFAYLIYFRNFKAIFLLLILIVLFQGAEIVKFVRGKSCHQIIIARSSSAGFICYHYQNRLICLFVDEPPQYVKRYFDNYRKKFYIQEINMICVESSQVNFSPHKIKLGNMVFLLSKPTGRLQVQASSLLRGGTEFILSPRYLLTIDSYNMEGIIEEKISIKDHGGYFLINLN